MEQEREKRATFELVSALGASAPHLKASQGQGLYMHATACNTLPHLAIVAGFLDLTRLLGRVMGSDMFLSVCNTYAGQ